MNKKLLALLLAILMVAMSAVAMANGTDEEVIPDRTTTTVPIQKSWTTDTIIPAQTIKFDVTTTDVEDSIVYTVSNAPKPTVADLVFSSDVDVTVENAKKDYTLNVTLPDYTGVGKFTYKITEQATNILGVTNNTTEVYIQVLVEWNDSHTDFVKTWTATKGPNASAKEDSFTNTFTDADLKITKSITGNMADKTARFPVQIKLNAGTKTVGNEIGITGDLGLGTEGQEGYTAPVTKIDRNWSGEKTVTVYVSDNSTIKLSNLPSGITYTVSETDLTQKLADDTTVTYTKSVTGAESGTIGSTDVTVAYTNTLSSSIDTGVSTDSMPYILLMAFVAILAVAFVAKKRSVNE